MPGGRGFGLPAPPAASPPPCPLARRQPPSIPSGTGREAGRGDLGDPRSLLTAVLPLLGCKRRCFRGRRPRIPCSPSDRLAVVEEGGARGGGGCAWDGGWECASLLFLHKEIPSVLTQALRVFFRGMLQSEGRGGKLLSCFIQV